MRNPGLFLTAAAVLVACPVHAQEVDPVKAFEASLHYEQGTITLGDGLATLIVPDEFRFLGPEDARRLLVEGWGNPPMDPPLGLIVPYAVSPMSDEGWAVVITYEEDGYVEDDDAADIDYAELLVEMQEDTRAENELRQEEGYPSIELVGWAAPPHYDPEANKLYWAQELAFGQDGVNTLNYNVRILGRRGVLVMNAVASMPMLEAIETDMQSVMSFVQFNEGHRYSDFDPNVDRVAAYGIGALVAGKVAAKAGLFKLLLAALVAGKKMIAIAVVAVAAFFRKLRGRGEPEPSASAMGG
jgi:uncharacterized membrane-anchored protein